MLSPRPEVIWDTVDERLVVFDLTTQDVLELNATAALIWQQLPVEGESDLVAFMSRLYPNVASETIAKDVFQIIEDLKAASLLVRHDVEGTPA